MNNPYFRAAMEYLHDLAVGAFPGAVLAAWMLQRGLAGASSDVLRQLGLATTGLWLILVASLIVVGATGAFRLKWWRLNVRAGAMDAKRRMILIKHTAFALTLIVAAGFMFTLVPS